MSVTWITKLRLTITAFLVHKASGAIYHASLVPRLLQSFSVTSFVSLCDWKAEEELRSTFLVERGLGARCMG